MHAMQRVIGSAALFLVLAGCSQTVDPFRDTPNNPPNTVFLDTGIYESTPQPDELITSPTVSLYCYGTDVIDGDDMSAYHYRVTPGDTTWTRVRRSGVFWLGLGDLRDTTYTVCVRAEDSRGAIDPEPTCRTFRVDVFRPGVIQVFADTTRFGDLKIQWELADSEIPPDDVAWSVWLQEWCNGESGPCARDSLLSSSGWFDVPNDPLEYFISNPDPDRLYCFSFRAKDPQGRGPEDVRFGYPRKNR